RAHRNELGDPFDQPEDDRGEEPAHELRTSWYNSSYWGTTFSEANRCAVAMAACTIAASAAGLRSNSTARRPMASTEPAGSRIPVTPSSITSGMPPARVATTGTPHAIASSAAR